MQVSDDISMEAQEDDITIISSKNVIISFGNVDSQLLNLNSNYQLLKMTVKHTLIFSKFLVDGAETQIFFALRFAAE